MAQSASGQAGFDWRDLSQQDAWQRWRDAKLRGLSAARSRAPVSMESLAAADGPALGEIFRRCALDNFAIYRTATAPATVEAACRAVVHFAGRLGLELSESHRSAEDNGVVVLRPTSEPGKQGYIPYSSKPMSWHTDGYYNAPETPVMSFILHCHEQASTGGENQLVDPEMAYLAMRDENPGFVRAMMHPQAMAIPENREEDGSLRPASVGPVFFAHPGSGRLQMRYTARTRSIAWRQDGVTAEAADWLRGWLTGGSAATVNVRLQAGEGIVSNNVLHNRTGFEDASHRAILRLRFHDRIKEDCLGAA